MKRSRFQTKNMEPAQQCDKGKSKTNNSVEGWRKVFQLELDYAHPTVSKFIQHIKKEQKITEVGRKTNKCRKYEQLQQSMSENLNIIKSMI